MGSEMCIRDREAGDSLMMKLGEASNRLSRAGVDGPDGVEWPDAIANRNWLIHQYDEVDRHLTWVTLSRDLVYWRAALADTFTLTRLVQRSVFPFHRTSRPISRAIVRPATCRMTTPLGRSSQTTVSARSHTMSCTSE